MTRAAMMLLCALCALLPTAAFAQDEAASASVPSITAHNKLLPRKGVI